MRLTSAALRGGPSRTEGDNPKVVGSDPASITKILIRKSEDFTYLLFAKPIRECFWQNRNIQSDFFGV